MARFTGREPFATVDGLRMAKYKMFFSSAKAERELGYRARPAADGSGGSLSLVSRRGVSKVTAVDLIAAIGLVAWTLPCSCFNGGFWLTARARGVRARKILGPRCLAASDGRDSRAQRSRYASPVAHIARRSGLSRRILNRACR